MLQVCTDGYHRPTYFCCDGMVVECGGMVLLLMEVRSCWNDRRALQRILGLQYYVSSFVLCYVSIYSNK